MMSVFVGGLVLQRGGGQLRIMRSILRYLLGACGDVSEQLEPGKRNLGNDDIYVYLHKDPASQQPWSSSHSTSQNLLMFLQILC